MPGNWERQKRTTRRACCLAETCPNRVEAVLSLSIGQRLMRRVLVRPSASSATNPDVETSAMILPMMTVGNQLLFTSRYAEPYYDCGVLAY